jgi:hypothetical protein
VTEGSDIKGTVAVIAVGVGAIGLGCKGFTARGLPLSKSCNITGKPAKVIGVLCMLLGAAFICFALYELSLTW